MLRQCIGQSLSPRPPHVLIVAGLIDLQKENGLFAHAQHAEIGGVKSKCASYMPSRSQRELLKALADSAHAGRMDDARSCPAIGLILDETTDAANKPQIVFYYRHVMGGRVHTTFAGYQVLPRATPRLSPRRACIG